MNSKTESPKTPSYKSFKIENYKAIDGPLEINLSKNKLMPIIGINEFGKTTILKAILAFDQINDSSDPTYKHLTDISNLYKTSKQVCKLTATIEIDERTLYRSYNEGLKEAQSQMPATLDIQKLKPISIPKSKQNGFAKYTIEITREITDSGKFYNTSFKIQNKEIDDVLQNFVCHKIILRLPYILYFDEFKDSFPDKIEINKLKNEGWLETIDELFKATNQDYSVYKLKDIENRQRKGVISDVEAKLNDSLTKQWTNFKLDALQYPLTIKIDYEETLNQLKNESTYHLSFEIVEKNHNGGERTFYIRDRSKGFYWFFNFVMKLEFNAKKVSEIDREAIYLLDEPGSFLHPYAQSMLCKKLVDLSKDNIVIYCTHTPYLLDPKIIPVSKIYIAEKSTEGSISLVNYHDYHTGNTESLVPFQPIIDALEIQQFDISIPIKKALLVEGIYDFYCFTMFTNVKDLTIIPGKNAVSLTSLISILIGIRSDFRVLWDNDHEGNKHKNDAELFFGENIAKDRFFSLPSSKGSKTILQDLFNGSDLNLIKQELSISNSSFNKTIVGLYYSPFRDKILEKISQDTKNRFIKVLEHINLT